MIEGLVVRELESHLGREGVRVDIWDAENVPGPHAATSCHLVFPGVVEAWIRHRVTFERVVCLEGMLKLVACDRREESPSRGEVKELFMGEFRSREVIIPPGVLRGWKAVGNRPALVLLTLEGEREDGTVLAHEEAGVPYDWEIVME